MTTGVISRNRTTRSELDKVIFAPNEPGPSRRPRQSTSSVTTSVKCESDDEESPPAPAETQFRSQGEDSDDQLWEADCILDERGETAKGEYLVKWVGFDPITGENWEPTWERRDGVTPLLAKEWKARKKADPDIVGVEGKKLQVARKKKQDEERRKKRDARKSKKGKKKARTSEVVDLTTSRSPTVDTAYAPGRTTKRTSRVSTIEKETPVRKPRKSEPPVSTSSSKNVPVVELPLRPRLSALAIESDQEHPGDVAEPVLEDNGDDLMAMYTNDQDFEPDLDPSEVPENAVAVEAQVEESTVPPPVTNKRSAPASSPPVHQPANGRQKRVRIDPVVAPATSPPPGLSQTQKIGPKITNKVGKLEEANLDGSKGAKPAVKPAIITQKSVKDESMGPILLPSDAQFRALLPTTNDSSQGTTSTGPGQSQLDPIQQFSSPDRSSLLKSKVAAKANGTSNLAKGVHTLLVDGQEVLGVDSDSGSEGGLENEQESAISQVIDADVVDNILAPVEASPVIIQESASLPAPETDAESPPLEPEVTVEETVAALMSVDEVMNASAAIVNSIVKTIPPSNVVSAPAIGIKSATGPAASSSKSTSNSASTGTPSRSNFTSVSATSPPKATTPQDLEILALRQMIAELTMKKMGSWKGKGKTSDMSETDSTKVRGLAAEFATHWKSAVIKVKASAEPDSKQDTVVTSVVGSQTDATPVMTPTVTTDVALQTDPIPAPSPAAVNDAASQTNAIAVPTPAEPVLVTDSAAQTDFVPPPPVLDQTSFEQQLAAKDADRKKWRTRAKRAEGEVTTLQEDLQFIRDQYQEASASAVREVTKSTVLEEKMTILQGQLKHGLKQRDLHHSAVKGQQDKQVAILTAQNKILLEQSRRTDDDVRSRAAAYHEVEAQREELERLLRNAMRKIDDLSDRNDELVSQIEILRAKQMGVLGDDLVKDDPDDEDYSYDEESDAESSAAPSPTPSRSPSLSPSPSTQPTQTTQQTQSTRASGSAVVQSTSAFIVSTESLTASQLMPDTQDLLSAQQSLESNASKVKKPSPNTQAEGERKDWKVYQSPWVEGTFFPNESAIKEHIMDQIDRQYS